MTLLEAIAQLGRKPFVRNVGAMAGGTVVAQAIAVIFAPLIARLYGPEAFGVQGIFMSIAMFLAPASTLVYPMAIILAQDEREVRSLCWLSIMAATMSSFLAGTMLVITGSWVFEKLDVDQVSGLACLIPIYMLAAAVSSVTGQWLIRERAFILTAKVSIVQSLLVGIIKVGQGIIHPSSSALVVINTLAGLLNALLTLAGLQRATTKNPASVPVNGANADLWTVAKRYRDFPLLRAPQVLINSGSQILPVIMLASSFGAATVGHYTLAVMVLALPARVVGEAVSQVFYPRVSEAVAAGEDVVGLIARTTTGLAVAGALPLLVVVSLGPTLFELVFGTGWRTAGTYAQWLSVWLYFQYINKPAVAAVPALGIQSELLLYEVCSTAAKALALYVGYSLFGSDLLAIALFSLAGTVAYIWLIAWVIVRSRSCSRRY